MNEIFYLNAEQLYLFVYDVFMTGLNNIVCQFGFNRMINTGVCLPKIFAFQAM